MRSLLNPRWLLLLNTGPLLVLAVLCYGEFSIIQTLLPPASVAVWQQLALGLAALGTTTLAYAAWAWWRGRPLSTWYAGAALLAYAAFLAYYTTNDSLVLPRDIPRWMVPTDILVYVWTFLMPTLAHALLVLVVRSVPPDEQPRSSLPSFGLAVVCPAGAWLFYLLLEASDRVFGDWGHAPWVEATVGTALAIAMLAAGPLAFLFFLVRGVYLLTLNRDNSQWSLVGKLTIGLLLPLLGLFVNAGLFVGGLTGRSQGIFGNFNTPWFYGLAVLNGVLLCLPRPAAPGGRVLLLAARSALLGYTGYFFLVFLPWLPLSLLAVIAIGTGFLMLTPLLLLVVHLRTLADDVAALHGQVPRWVPRAVLAGGAVVLPLLLTADYYHDRQVLHAALAYVYTPNYAKTYDLDAASLARTLAVVRQHKDSSRDFFMGSQQPYLSAYFNWLVLDNLMLSDSKLTTLESVFLPGATASAAAEADFPRADPKPTAPVLRQLTARSTYDASQQAWVSWVNLEVGNVSPAQQVGEYSTTFKVPAGCWVSDYYLDIEGRREPGLLAERKAADWVYTQILHQNDRRDPGLLTYVGPGQARLQVYPVVDMAPRRTGFQLLHKEPVTLILDGQLLTLGQPGVASLSEATATPDGAVVYLSAAAKQRLPLVQRQPYYHFLVDVSATKAGQKKLYKQWIADFRRQHATAAPPRFTFVNTYATPVAAGADWQRQLDAFPNAGGCYLTGAVQRTLAEGQLHPAASYPVLVVVTDTLAGTVLALDFANLDATYPESDKWLVLKAGGEVEVHSLRQQSARALPEAMAGLATGPPVRAWPTAAHPRAYLPDDTSPAVVLSQPAASLGSAIGPATRWQAGLRLRGYEQWQALHPAEAEAQRVAFVQASFRSRILSPLTAFLALENEAQKAALRRKQAQTLAANGSLDAQEEPATPATAVPLDDYVPWLLLLGLGLGSWRLRWSARLRSSH